MKVKKQNDGVLGKMVPHFPDISSLFFFISCSLLVPHVDGRGTALTFELPDNERTCFSESFKGPGRFIFEYRVLRGGNNDVDVSVISPNGKILYKEIRKSADIYELQVSMGEFEFCFSNEFSTFSHKVVFIDLKPVDTDNLAVEAGNKRPSANTASEAACDEIHDSMNEVVNYQKDFRLKEAISRFQAEILNQRVLWWSVFQTIIIAITAITQVMLVKMFFTKPRLSALLPSSGEVIYHQQLDA